MILSLVLAASLFDISGERVVVGRYDFGGQAPLVRFTPATGEIATIDRAPDATPSNAIRHETVRFGGLEGRLTLPTTDGPHPVVIMIHGSGPASRDFAYYGVFATHLASYGLGVLTYDKRADWKSAVVRDLAQDAAAAVDYLRTRRDVDPKRIGAFGHSQGGWIAPLVAVQRDLAFVCALAAPAVSTTDQELDETANDLRAHGYGDAEIAEAHVALREMFRLAAADDTAGLAALIASTRAKPWGKYADMNGSAAELRRFVYDPRPTIEALRVPALVLLGERDPIVPPERNASLWKKYAPAVELTIVPDADHGLFMARTTADHGHGQDGAAWTKQFAPGVVERITNWLLASARLKARFVPLADLVGTWVTDNGEVMSIQPLGSMYLFVDFARGRTAGFERPAPGSDAPVVGHGMVPTPVRVALVDGDLRVREAGLVERRAKRVPLEEEEIHVTSGDITLRGTLVLPAGKDPTPAVVFAHGSGPSSRTNFVSWARYFAMNGIAAVAYDKRGTATLDDLAGDLRAVVGWMQNRSDIRRDAVGVIGTNQGSPVAAMAAAKNESIAFVVASGGGSLDPLETISQPVLILAAGLDANMPSIPPSRLTVKTFPEANPAFQLPAKSGDIPLLAPGYFEAIRDWIKTILRPVQAH